MSDTKNIVWEIEPKFKSKLQIGEAKLIFEEAEKSLLETIETSYKILDRSSTLLQLITGLLVGLVAYSIGHWETKELIDRTLITAVAGMVYYVLLAIFFVFPNIKPNVYILPGAQPKNILIDTFFNVPDHKREIYYYIIKINNLQQGITINRSINEKRWEYYKNSLNLLFASPIVLTLMYLLLNFI